MIKLDKKYILKGKLIALSGLHIGGSDTGLSIGSPDSTVIKHPITLQPYIPGSSIKGKMRSLIELRDGTIGKKRMGQVENGPYELSDRLSGKLFGTASERKEGKEVVVKQQPSRIIVRDAKLSDKTIKEFNSNYSEIKTEVVIDRITSKAMPRKIERVPAQAEFDFEIVLNVFEGEEDMIKEVFNALELLQDDYLGGHGSRGSGQIQIKVTSLHSKSNEYYTGSGSKQLEDELESLKEHYGSLIA